MPLPVAFDGFIELSKRVSPTCLISFERNRYSVPASFANRPISLRIYPDRLVVAAEGNILCEHPRVIQRSHQLPPRTIYDWRHYLAVLQRKPGALRNGAPFLELPPAFRQLQGQMIRKPDGDREMVDILALVLQHDEQAVLTAVELALAEGVATKTHVATALGIQSIEQHRRRVRFDMICEANGIEHRLTKPNHPWTNGQVERMNRTIKDATVKRFHYDDHDQLRTHLADFMAAYNFARRLKTLGGLSPADRRNC